ncbi:hypothetical protein BDA96_03G040300 [Sorghum bicolor]|uniref:DUF8003 domain-containing protein n=2 Tax=Sorghum bicolor TaxID=4558 RepID=C5XM07_SORBI|nr:uncharacterized protein LOC8084363 [Sorghum bicolor]EES02326.1 hypothetical protein SORBI_3003G036900 [Sorghum bicolor]KAG0536156.1 hypothetical protein BDA96_03G040300 [Sorghum bicolor]|eukprot:XP_002457206.1 uncharacterized protein LOC8084363 [Sorghum bicolor]
MACHLCPLLNLRLLLLLGVVLGNAGLSRGGGAEASDRAEPDPYSILMWHDYSPPSPPLPPPDPASPTATCEGDLHGKGDFLTRCEVSEEVELGGDVRITGNGSLVLLSGASLTCEKYGCVISANLSGEVRLGRGVRVIAGRVTFVATNITVADTVVVNTTALAGDPPDRTSGVPTGTHGDGGGHGGRGASCFVKEGQTQEDSWGGDAYAWSDLEHPWSYGSKGGSTSVEKDYGGAGGGIVWLFAEELVMNGTVLADGGDSNEKGGGGSGGSIFIKAASMHGGGKISASGGDGLAGGGGGRVSINVFSRHDDTQIFVHGGRSSGCPDNAGAAGTLYEAVPKSLIVSNNNLSTQTDTLLLEFPNQPLWTNVFVRNRAKVAVPLLWSRVQVEGQLSLLSGAILTFGLTRYPYSEFELMAEELLMSDSTIKVFGALRMSVKMLLMWNSRMEIDGGGDSIVATSLLDASNLIVLKESSVIHSNANLGVRGQGLLNLSGDGDTIEAQILILSLFYSIQVGPGSVLRGPLVNRSSDDVAPKLNCEADSCPVEIIHPPEDCNLNSSLSFTLQVCRVEDIDVWGLVQGTVIHFNRARSVTVYTSGTISASGLGCRTGVGQGKMLSSGVCGGGGHGGKGGNGSYNGSLAEGGAIYGNADLPCELGSGSGNDSTELSTAGGGIIVMGSWEYSLPSLALYGSVESNGGSYANGSVGGPGGGSGGTILLFVHTLSLAESSVLSSVGGFGSSGSGGGGGGRIHFHWSNIPTGDEYVPVAAVKGSILASGGVSKGPGYSGGNGTVTGKACPKGLYGTFCKECPIGTYKNVTGSSKSLCFSCPSGELPHRAIYINVRGGATETPCPYRCMSDRYRMPHCYTALEELIYTFGGPWLFGLLLSGLLILLALVLSVARMKFVGTDELPGPAPTQQGSQIDHSFPFLESLNEVIETNRAEESHGHVHRMYFMGPNTFSEPWHLSHSPPEQITEIVYEDAFTRFVDEINTLAAYQWWEGSIYSILCILAYPLAWSWQQWRRRKKLQRLREFVRSEYDHSCLRSCRSRALYEGLKVTATPDLMLGYLDFFLGGDEKRPDLPPRLRQRFPMSLIFGGDGSYMAPFSLNSDSVLTSLMSQAVPSWIWHRLVAGLNAQLRLVRCGNLKVTFLPVIDWLETHANPSLAENGIRVDLAWFQATALGYCQFGLLVYAVEGEAALTEPDGSPRVKTEQHTPTQNMLADTQLSQSRIKDALMRKRITGGVLDSNSLRTLKDRRDLFYPFSLILHNSKPVGHQDLVGLVISILLLADFSLVLLTFLQLYSYSMVDVLLVLFILPLGILSPFPAGINALFSHGPRRSAGLARVYALWNITSLVNVVVAFICGFVHYKSSTKTHPSLQPWNLGTDESGWWLFPTGLMLLKCIQARLVDWHVANLEIQDRAVYSNDPNIFWQS